jgi:hypothetical protein
MPTTPYLSPLDQLLALGIPQTADAHQDYTALGISLEHVSELIRLATDEELRWGDASDEPALWGPIHAWYALGQLRAASAVEPLLGILYHIDEDDDEWALEEMPEVFAQIGPAAIPALAAFLADADNRNDTAGTVSESLRQLAIRFPDSRAECVSAIMGRLERFTDNDEWLNASLINDLAELKAAEALSLMERAFAAQVVDETLGGDWEDLQIKFGLKTEREHPRRRGLLSGLTPLASWPTIAEEAQAVPEHIRLWNAQVEARQQAKFLVQVEKSVRQEEKGRRHRKKK